MPSDLLLHYNYGAAAVKQWGHGIETFSQCIRPPCPPTLILAPTDRQNSVRDKGAADSKEAEWDEDDVMLFMWGNSRAATERHNKKRGEDVQRMEQWREDVRQHST